jgi:hypothetical protein
MRDYQWMPPKPKKKNLLANPAQKDADDEVLCRFATSIHEIGFRSDEISNLMGLYADREIAQKALLRARKPDRYHYPEAVFEANVKTMMRLFSTAQRATAEQANAALEVDISDEPPERCGKPLTHDQERDRLSLFLDKLHNTDEEVFDEMSSFFIRRSVYFAYFGRLSGDTAMSTTSAQPPDPGAAQEEVERDRIIQEQIQIIRERAQQDRIAHKQAAQEKAAREQAEQAARDRLAREQAEQAARDRLAREQAE